MSEVVTAYEIGKALPGLHKSVLVMLRSGLSSDEIIQKADIPEAARRFYAEFVREVERRGEWRPGH